MLIQISFVRNVDEITQPQCIQIRSNFLSEICLIIAQNQTLSLFLVNLARYVKSYNTNCTFLKFYSRIIMDILYNSILSIT